MERRNDDAIKHENSINTIERVNVLRGQVHYSPSSHGSSTYISSQKKRRKSSVRFDAAAINFKESKRVANRSTYRSNSSDQMSRSSDQLLRLGDKVSRSSDRSSRSSDQLTRSSDRLTLLSNTIDRRPCWKKKLHRFLQENRWWETFLCLVGVAQFILLSVETEHRYRPSLPHLNMEEYQPGAWVYLANLGFTIVSLIEVVLWLIASPGTYLSSGANSFNLATCVCSAITDLFGCTILVATPSRSRSVAAVRDVIQVCGNLRIFRLWRSFGRQWGSHIVVRGLLFALSALGRVAVLGFIFLYVFANVAARMFSSTSAVEMGFRWGSLTDALFSLFLMLTFDGWSELAMDTEQNHPESPAFFVIFIWTTGVVLLSVVTSVMVQAYIDSSRALRADELYRQEIQRESQLLHSYISIFGEDELPVDDPALLVDEESKEAISLIKRFGATAVTPKQIASACTLVATEEGSSRQFYKTHVEAQTLQESLQRRMEALERAALETDCMVFELVNKLHELRSGNREPSFRKQGSTLAPLRNPVPDIRQVSSDERSFLTHVASQSSAFFF